MKKHIFILLAFIIFLASCEKKSFVPTSDNITITTFNMSWLGDGYKDKIERTDEDYENFASIIKSLNSDIVACQEIENGRAIQKILNYLPDYKYFISKLGNAQKLAVIYKKDLILSNIQEIRDLALGTNSHRPGLSFYVKKNNFDFEVINVHLKSTSHYDNDKGTVEASKEIRSQQVSALNAWVNNYLQSGKEQDVVIIGDFNDTPRRKIENTLQELVDNQNIVFITENLKSGGKFRNSYVIDNIAVTKSVMPRLVPGSLMKYDIFNAYSKEKAEKLSDHCPVSVQFNCAIQDND